MEDIEISGCKREQLIKLMVKHLLDSGYEFSLNHEDSMTKIDLGNYGSVLVGDNSLDLGAHKKINR